MSLNSVPSAERLHIAFFGRRNVGKSSLINAVTGQNTAIVSDVKGTTTDPVKKAMELLPLGAVVIIDTPGVDDVGELGKMRVKKTCETLARTDIAVIVAEPDIGLTEFEKDIINKVKEKNIPYIIAWNKSDLTKKQTTEKNEIAVSAASGNNINKLKELIASMRINVAPKGRIIADMLEENDVVVLVIPIDESAPKGRLILPQQQTIRDILDANATALCVKPEQLSGVIDTFGSSIKMVVTDSQAFQTVQNKVPQNIPLTSFSILMARYKGDLKRNASAAKMLDNLSDGDCVLISEACTHHRQCNDIGTVKLPKLVEKYTGKRINFEWTSGNEFSDELEKYKLVIHCGGCMINASEMQSRLEKCEKAGVPITNYGIAIAKMTGILDRSIAVFNGKY